MIFDLDTEKRIFKNSSCSNLASFAINFKFEAEDRIISSFMVAVLSFIITYLLIYFLAFFGKKKQEKIHVRAFYFTIIALLANSIISLAAILVNYLFKTDLFEMFAFPLLISMGTTPFFIILLLTWLSIKASQYLRNRSRNTP